MRRTLACVLTLLITLVTAHATAAKKSRSKASSSGSHVKREAGRSRSTKARSSRDKRGNKAVASRGKRGGRGARGRSSRREMSDTVASGSSRPSPGIPQERVTEIQTALIKAGFLDGPATGQYDDATVDAIKQYQGQNGMPQTGLPSAPFLKRLGVSKRSNDGYAVPVNAVSETEKKRPTGEKPQL